MLEGLRAVEEMWHNREGKIKTLKTEGRKVAGYLCCYVPLEILTAADLIPYRIIGSLKEPLDVVGSYLEDNFCPYIRSCFEIAMKGK
jgi:benzoyl-CoA reductase/2-hydroxyglutaryl-CoA dehydratase subunit BcrC/BadD/HgdB